MKHFTIDAENNIIVHASRKAACATGAGVFATEEQFADLIGPDSKRLIEIWNSLPGVKPVTKFTNRKVATERIWRAVAELGGPRLVEADPILEVSAPPFSGESASVRVNDRPSAAPSEPSESLATVGPEVPVVALQRPRVAPAKGKVGSKATPAKNGPKAKKAATVQESAGPREGSKTAQVVAMLQRKNGATLSEVMEKMEWQKHTVRGFMAGAMRKAGYTIESFKPEGGERTYRINQ